jgi:hypothetical protein
MDSNNNSSFIQPQDEMEKTCGCKKEKNLIMDNPAYIYAIGKISFRYPDLSIENEVRQASGRKAEDIKGLAQPEVINKIVTDPNNRYLARHLCWILEIENLPTYIIVPSDPLDIENFTNALRVNPERDDIDVIIGTRGPIARPDMCNGLMLPIVSVDQLYSFDKDELLKGIPKRKGTNEDQFTKTANALFEHIIQLADNVGATDEHRAINYLSMRYDQIYHRTQLMQDDNYFLHGIEVRLSRLANTRKILDVILIFENRNSAATEKWFARVDVSGKFPFLVSPLQQYYER